jgi:hypothetical protein
VEARASSKRKVGAAALGVAVLAALVAWLLWDSPPEVAQSPPPPAMPGPRLSEPGPAAVEPPPRPELVATPAPPPAQAEEGAPVIDEITVEKREVCEGEENLVTVRAHTTNGTDAFLNYLVGGRKGQQVPVRSWIADDGENPKLEVKVFGRNNVVTTAEVPAFVVKPCKPARLALITTRLRANTWSEFDFEVKINESGGVPGAPVEPFKPKLYEWSFGDGEKAATQLPYASHNYEGRKQDSMFSHLLIEVKIHGETGEPLVGRTSMQLLNPAYEDLSTKGVVTLLVQLTPRFPELGSDGVVRQKVRLFHHRDRPVFIHNAVLFRHKVTPGEPVAQQVVDPSGLLGTSVIPPGKGIEFEARLDTRKDGDVFSLEHYVEGKDSEGLTARGSFSVMRPPKLPTKENSMPVQDPLLKEKILAARKILNRPYVTDEDIWALQRQGKFAELEAKYQAAQGQKPPAVDPRDRVSKDPGPPPEGPSTPGGTGDESKEATPPKPTPKPTGR